MKTAKTEREREKERETPSHPRFGYLDKEILGQSGDSSRARGLVPSSRGAEESMCGPAWVRVGHRGLLSRCPSDRRRGCGRALICSWLFSPSVSGGLASVSRHRRNQQTGVEECDINTRNLPSCCSSQGFIFIYLGSHLWLLLPAATAQAENKLWGGRGWDTAVR